ncbi:lysozyme inhibitor LprI family protein [Pseudomonas sp. GD03860]|uniref:lysozyme inhibitor LprI family protein n=1 Tax=Pseudomonas TaxID=286 RepID=UPI00236388F1|nr:MULTISPECIES: lysozyme inhibitor LprI family protein [Pseudomonas]MDD2060604.1 lysozyme inhibitor LprI family protein [Pseudomonas putida]MDH0637820.1 lysozyme inhibitor LprI family protein [Pseudomonas sp. GD03860]
MKPLLAIALLSAMAPFAIAKDDYSAAYSQCMDTAQTTLAMSDCNGAEIKRQDTRLNAAYKAAMASLEAEQQGKLRDVQRLWIKYRDANCGLYFGLTGGTIDQLNGAGCVLSMTKDRADELQNLLGP